MNRPRLAFTAEPARDPIAHQQRTALAILAFGAEAAERFMDGSAELDTLQPYVREKLRRVAVALAATVADITDNIQGRSAR